MLSLIGLIAVIYLAIKFLPDIVMFAVKMTVCFVVLYFLLKVWANLIAPIHIWLAF